MADTKIKDLTAKTTVVTTDELVINDVAGGDVDKKEGMDDIRTFMLPTNAETKTAYEANADTNEFSDTEQTKLSGIETLATTDQTGAEIKTAYEAEANAFTDSQFTKLGGIETLQM